MVNDGRLAVSGKMVRGAQSCPESGIDLGYQFFSKRRFRDVFNLIDEHTFPVAIKSLTLRDPEESPSFSNQTCIPAATGVNSYWILRMRRPVSMKR